MNRQCQATTKAGTPCKTIPALGNPYCPAHDPARDEERRRLGSKGGRLSGKPHAELENIKIILYRIADAVEGGSIDARRGAVLVQVYNAIRGCIEDQRRIRELEDVIARLVKKLTGTAPHPAGPGMADIKRTARGAMKGSSRKAFYGIDRL